jgi:hypothetical protein
VQDSKHRFCLTMRIWAGWNFRKGQESRNKVPRWHRPTQPFRAGNVAVLVPTGRVGAAGCREAQGARKAAAPT